MTGTGSRGAPLPQRRRGEKPRQVFPERDLPNTSPTIARASANTARAMLESAGDVVGPGSSPPPPMAVAVAVVAVGVGGGQR